MRKNTKQSSDIQTSVKSIKESVKPVCARPAKQEEKPVIAVRAQKKPRPALSPAKEVTVARKALDLAVAAPSQPATKFVFFAPEAAQVSLCGEFNNWSPDATPMKRQSDGKWETAIPLLPGQYQYKFFVDGQWLNDPNASQTIPNSYGTVNSVIEVKS
jgi:hypothetical protein